MSGKRSLKKQQKRQASTLAELEESLARADLGRLDRLLRSLRRNGPLRPLAILAKAVLDLAAGRLDGARSSLAALAHGEAADAGDGKIPPGFLADLATLARDDPDRPREDDGYPRAAAELFAALKTLEARADAPTAADRETVARRLKTLRALAPPETPETLELGRFLDGADRCLALLDELTELAAALSGLSEDEARQAILAWMRRTGPALGPALGTAVPALLAPLRQAVAMQWRSVLEGVAARQGPPGLAALWAADPKLLAAHVDLPPGQEGLRRRTQAQQLLAGGRYQELADLLRSRGRTASGTAELAALWSLELWARNRPDQRPDQEEAEDFLDLLEDPDEPLPHRTLVRLAEMAGEIGRRFPAEQRAEVARVLAGELFDLCDAVGFCDHTAGAALSLLEHLPGDAGLLLAGLAGSISGGAPRALQALVARRDRAGKGTAGDLPIARRLLAEAAREDPWALALILEAVRPLFSADVWPELAELVARKMGGSFAEVLSELSVVAMADPREGDRMLGEAQKGLAQLRPALAGTLGFAAAELAIDCWQQDRPAVEQRLARFLVSFPGWDDVLAALEVLDQARRPWSPDRLNLALGSLAKAVVDRLDDRWQLWCHAVPMLAFAAEAATLKLLEKRVRLLLGSPEVQGEGRETLEAGLRAIQRIKDLRRGPARPRRRAKGTKGAKQKPRRRPDDAPQHELDFP